MFEGALLKTQYIFSKLKCIGIGKCLTVKITFFYNINFFLGKNSDLVEYAFFMDV